MDNVLVPLCDGSGADVACIWRSVMAFPVIALPLQWIWETAHGVAYVETNMPLTARLWHCIPMAILDTAWSGAIVLLGIGIATALQKPSAVWAVAAIAGAITAVGLEKLALDMGRWRYNDLMPIMPVVNVGLWPVLQMSVLPPLTLYVATGCHVQRNCREPRPPETNEARD